MTRMEEHPHTERTGPVTSSGRRLPAVEAWPPRELSTREAAAVLGLTERGVRYAIARGTLPAIKRGGAYRLDGEELARFAARTERGARPRPIERVVVLPTPTEAAQPLPAPASSFLGRDDDLSRLTSLLADPVVRIVTLTGPGGIGKTRLALAAASSVRGVFPDGVVFVALAAVFQADLVVPAIATALDLRKIADGDHRAQLRAFLRARRLLLVLDNVEQVLAAAPAVARLVEEAPGLTLLATSRAPLRVGGEREMPVPPLALPNDGTTPDELLRSDAGRLFVARAGA